MKTKTLVFPEKNCSFWHFNSLFVLKHLLYITKQKTPIESQQLFDEIIDITLFDGVEGLD